LKILGISFDVYPSSAAIIVDNQIIAACAEERLNRIKYCKSFPFKAIEFVLEKAKCDIEDVDCISVGWNPAYHINNYNPRFSDMSRWRGEQLTVIPNSFSRLLRENISTITQKINKHIIKYVDHHQSHAGIYYISGFEKATIVTVDGMGENQTVTISIGQNNKINCLYSQLYPHSLGLFYGTLTQFLGFHQDRDEWKVMALAAYGTRENNHYINKISQLIKLTKTGFELDLSFFTFYLHDQKNWFSQKMIDLLGDNRKNQENILNKHIQIAYAVQFVFENTMYHIIDTAITETKIKNLVFAGGCAMNSVFNGKIRRDYNVYISPFPDDTGVSIGSALITNAIKAEIKNNYLGPSNLTNDIKELLEKFKLKYYYIKDKEKLAARLLHEDYIIGWHQGRMEFGQRALGGRSILANPMKHHNRNRINSVIKGREWFRPLAATCLYEKVNEFFDNATNSFYMEKVFQVKREKMLFIPAVVHVDNSCRIQTLKKEFNESFYNLIQEFEKLSGVPLILNTSLNSANEPIICYPEQSIKMFYTSAMDIMFIENFVVAKNDISI